MQHCFARSRVQPWFDTMREISIAQLLRQEVSKLQEYIVQRLNTNLQP